MFYIDVYEFEIGLGKERWPFNISVSQFLLKNVLLHRLGYFINPEEF